MGLLDQQILDGIKIGRLIFHVVGPNEDDLVLMDEIVVTGFERFFLDRIRETNIGNRFQFIGAQSGVRPALQGMNENPEKFLGLTKNIAETFQAGHRAVAAAKGAFIIAEIIGAGRPAFALIKFDDLKVLRFRQESTTSGGVRAIVSEVDNTFVEDRKAMQKSALVLLSDDGGDLAVFDRSNKQNISEYFKAFLGVRRLWQPEDATKRLKDAFETAFQLSNERAPEDIRRSWRHRLHSATRKRNVVEPGEDFNVFGAQIFGPFWEDDEFRTSVDRQLHLKRISGEAIEIAKEVIRRPNMRRLRTQENVQIVYPKQLDEADEVVTVKKQPDGTAIITIRTQGITNDELLDEGSDRRASPTR